MSSVAFTTEDVGRLFIGCDRCRRVMPHYRVYGRQPKTGTEGMCACGSTQFRPVAIPEWKAAIWVLVVGWFWRKTIKQEQEWDPRVPFRNLSAIESYPR